MAVIGQFADWIVTAVGLVWSAMTTQWGIVGLAIIGAPIAKKVFNLFKMMLRGAV